MIPDLACHRWCLGFCLDVTCKSRLKMGLGTIFWGFKTPEQAILMRSLLFFLHSYFWRSLDSFVHNFTDSQWKSEDKQFFKVDLCTFFFNKSIVHWFWLATAEVQKHLPKRKIETLSKYFALKWIITMLSQWIQGWASQLWKFEIQFPLSNLSCRMFSQSILQVIFFTERLVEILPLSLTWVSQNSPCTHL